MIVKVLGLSPSGECLERQAESVGLWETEKNLKKMMRDLAARYLATWSHVHAVDIRRDEDHKRIVKVVRKADARIPPHETDGSWSIGEKLKDGREDG